MNIALSILLLGILVLLHEAGHLAAAHLCGVKVRRFSVGLGPALWKRDLGGVEYRLSWIPFGGYVLPALDTEAQSFAIPVRKRILFALGGPAANILACLPLFALMNFLAGQDSLMALLFEPVRQTFGGGAGIAAAIPQIAAQPDQMSGVVGIVAAGSGLDFGGFLRFAALLNLNLAVLNLLPFPPLDGGKIVLSALERIHISARRLHLPATLTGVVLLLLLMAYSTGQDLLRLMGHG